MNYGGYNLVVKVLDCDSENTGSSPVTHPPIHNFCTLLSRKRVSRSACIPYGVQAVCGA